ncbi:hypothetical protein HMPREF2902_02780 [Actinomyces sp. HMSC035G02]|nr:hypothetical protein HMPREF2902_02780 [Actinomyces sp. HMSC035G02]
MRSFRGGFQRWFRLLGMELGALSLLALFWMVWVLPMTAMKSIASSIATGVLVISLFGLPCRAL